MKTKKIKINKNFIGREYELNELSKISKENEASIIVIYGKRRIGKTELLEQAFRKRKVLKFEGLEGLSESKQMEHVIWQLSEYSENPIYTKVKVNSWTEIFKILADIVKQGVWTL